MKEGGERHFSLFFIKNHLLSRKIAGIRRCLSCFFALKKAANIPLFPALYSGFDCPTLQEGFMDGGCILRNPWLNVSAFMHGYLV